MLSSFGVNDSKFQQLCGNGVRRLSYLAALMCRGFLEVNSSSGIDSRGAVDSLDNNMVVLGKKGPYEMNAAMNRPEIFL